MSRAAVNGLGELDAGNGVHVHGCPDPSACSHPTKARSSFIGDFRFPEGDAAAVRTLSLARICRDLGFAVTVIGKGQVRAEDYVPKRDAYYIDGIRYSSMNPQPVSAIQKLRDPLKRLKLYVSALDAMDLTDTRAVVINACSSATHVRSSAPSAGGGGFP